MKKSNKIKLDEMYLQAEKRKANCLKICTMHHRKQRLLCLKQLRSNSNIAGIKAENHNYLKINMEV